MNQFSPVVELKENMKIYPSPLLTTNIMNVFPEFSNILLIFIKIKLIIITNEW